MPSSTDLPTPEPANRPIRWPPPTASSELIERTPTSSGSRIARRISGFNGSPVKRDAVAAMQFAEAVEWPPRAVQHAAQQAIPHGDRRHTARRNDARARHDAANIAGGHQEQLVARESHHLRLDLPAFGRVDETAAADGGFAADGLERHADHAIQSAFDHDLRRVRHALARARRVPRSIAAGALDLRRWLRRRSWRRRRAASRTAVPCPSARSRWPRGASRVAHRCVRWRW